MKIEEKIKKNREVFQNSPFFSHPRESISGEITEPFHDMQGAAGSMEVMPQTTPEERKKTFKEEETMRQAEKSKTEFVFAEEPFIQKDIPVFERVPVREMSDELERLSQRYGRGMEEWLDDQSPI